MSDGLEVRLWQGGADPRYAVPPLQARERGAV